MSEKNILDSFMKGIPLRLIKPASSILLQNILFLKYFFGMQQPFCWSVLENILIIVIIVFILLHIFNVFFNQIIIKLYVIKYSLLPFCLYNVILKIK